jgi:hypothetical protein
VIAEIEPVYSQPAENDSEQRRHQLLFWHNAGRRNVARRRRRRWNSIRRRIRCSSGRRRSCVKRIDRCFLICGRWGRRRFRAHRTLNCKVRAALDAELRTLIGRSTAVSTEHAPCG